MSADTPSQPPKSGTPPGDRIAKVLSRAGIASRREAERMIEAGRVRVNGAQIDSPALNVTPSDAITVDGKPVGEPEPPRVWLFHKPTGLVTTNRDEKGRGTIFDDLPEDMPRVMSIGRLDLNSEGLLLLTNDGELKRAMELPSSRVPRTYRARAFGDITQAQLDALIEGIEIDGVRYGRIEADLERGSGKNRWIEMTLTEGKNREVRRVLEHLGLQVNRLLRVGYGPYELGVLARGQAVEIRQAAVERFRKQLTRARK